MYSSYCYFIVILFLLVTGNKYISAGSFSFIKFSRGLNEIVIGFRAL
jgi:hypothetical protein